MKLTIISKNYGTQTIYTDSYNPMFASTSSTIFKVIEHIWNEWYEHNSQPGSPLGSELSEMYYGSEDCPAIYTRKGAIRQAIENLIEEALETKRTLLTTRDIVKMDIEAAFI